MGESAAGEALRAAAERLTELASDGAGDDDAERWLSEVRSAVEDTVRLVDELAGTQECPGTDVIVIAAIGRVVRRIEHMEGVLRATVEFRSGARRGVLRGGTDQVCENHDR